jgi:hypothetical protein
LTYFWNWVIHGGQFPVEFTNRASLFLLIALHPRVAIKDEEKKEERKREGRKSQQSG